MTSPANNPFRHRFDLVQAHDHIALQDAFNAMAGRAQGVLMLLSSHFEGEGRINDETILSSIDAVFHDINDMKAAIRAHFEAIKVINSTAKLVTLPEPSSPAVK